MAGDCGGPCEVGLLDPGVNWRLTDEEPRDLLAKSGARAFHWPELLEAPDMAHRSLPEASLLIYASVSTGRADGLPR